MSTTKHILISYITDTDLDNEVEEYENIINFIGSYFRDKDYHYVIAREPVINEKLKNSIPKSKVKEKIEELDKRIKSFTTEDEYKKLKIYTCKDFNEFITSVLQELLREE